MRVAVFLPEDPTVARLLFVEFPDLEVDETGAIRFRRRTSDFWAPLVFFLAVVAAPPASLVPGLMRLW